MATIIPAGFIEGIKYENSFGMYAGAGVRYLGDRDE